MQNTTKRNGKTILGLTKDTSYTKLLLAFPPRPISTPEQFLSTQQVIDEILDIEDEISKDVEDYLNLLGTLVYEYEEHAVHIPDIYGVELLKVLIEDSGLRQKDLVGVFKTESIASDVLNQKRKLTVEHIEKLSQFFNVSPAVFFELKQNTLAAV